MSIINIGSNSSMVKTIQLDKEYKKDSILFITSTHYNDIFNYEINGNELKIIRTDKPDENIISDDSFKITIDIGTSNEYFKIIQLDRNYSLNTVVKLEPNPYEDKFLFRIYNNLLVIKRIDKKKGWNYFHKAKIYEGWGNDLKGYIHEDNNISYDIGNSDHFEKKIPLNGFYPEGCVYCIEKNNFNDKFSIKYINNEISIERYDQRTGWNHFHKINAKRIKIPKNILQTHHTDLPPSIRNHLNKKAYGWNYTFFKDDDILLFFKANPIPEFPNIINVFNSIHKGQHKADLFRYYYLYLYGGVFLDSDAMIEKNLDDIIGTYNFVTVIAIDPSLYFNGFIATEPYNIIMYESIKEIYNCNINDVNNDYFKIIRDFKRITDTHKNKYNYKLYVEKGDWTGIMPTVDEENNDELIFNHYYHSKVVPNM